MFYKVIKDNKEIIDVLDNLIFVRKQITHNRLVLCDKDIAQGIISSNGENVWFVEGMIKNNPDELPTVTLVEIDEDEYNILREALDSNKPVEVPEPPKEENEEWEDDNNDEAITVEFVREAKISEMSRKCNETIVNGFDIELSDKKTHHFDFTVDDQIPQ